MNCRSAPPSSWELWLVAWAEGFSRVNPTECACARRRRTNSKARGTASVWGWRSDSSSNACGSAATEVAAAASDDAVKRDTARMNRGGDIREDRGETTPVSLSQRNWSPISRRRSEAASRSRAAVICEMRRLHCKKQEEEGGRNVHQRVYNPRSHHFLRVSVPRQSILDHALAPAIAAHTP